ncbi:hypothetical protein [Flaviflagellibacter deserti]|uniref:Uncharacterized protein n=1 Tax=Flaviflagellibacter deserti TaxID=2267266 RepID=A0ABV9Z4N2_9HYPH
MTILLRLFLIPVGYFGAVFMSASLIAAIEWIRAYGPVADDAAALAATTIVVVTDWIFLFAIIGYAAALPSLVVVALAEITAQRSALFFCGAGLAVAFAVSRIMDVGGDNPAVPHEPSIIAAAGLAGGLAYWVSSGRWSGFRRPVEPVKG